MIKRPFVTIINTTYIVLPGVPKNDLTINCHIFDNIEFSVLRIFTVFYNVSKSCIERFYKITMEHFYSGHAL